MVEREQGRDHRREDRAAEALDVVSDAVADLGPATGEEAKAARHARFLAALDEIMADHHNVLAALAK